MNEKKLSSFGQDKIAPFRSSRCGGTGDWGMPDHLGWFHDALIYWESHFAGTHWLQDVKEPMLGILDFFQWIWRSLVLLLVLPMVIQWRQRSLFLAKMRAPSVPMDLDRFSLLHTLMDLIDSVWNRCSKTHGQIWDVCHMDPTGPSIASTKHRLVERDPTVSGTNSP